MRYTVRCQSETGRTIDVHVYAGSDEAACRVALSQLTSDFRAVWALPS